MKMSLPRMSVAIAAWLAAGCLFAQNPERPAYMNPALSPQQRAEDLVHRMTVEEKVTQLVNQSRAVPRLNVPDYDWWSESLHGVARNGTTEFPEPVGLAATFDTDAIHRMAIVIGTEGAPVMFEACAMGIATSLKGWISGRRTSIAFAIRDGDAVRRLTAKIHF